MPVVHRYETREELDAARNAAASSSDRETCEWGPIHEHLDPAGDGSVPGGEYIQVYCGQHEWLAYRVDDPFEQWADSGWEADVRGWGWVRSEDKGLLATEEQQDAFRARLMTLRTELDRLSLDQLEPIWEQLLALVEDDITAEAVRGFFSIGNAFQIGPNRKNYIGLIWSDWNWFAFRRWQDWFLEREGPAVRHMKWVTRKFPSRGWIHPPVREGGKPVCTDDLLFAPRKKLREYLGSDDPLCPS